MRKPNGNQLYGIQKILTTLKMGMNNEKRLPELYQLRASPHRRIACRNMKFMR